MRRIAALAVMAATLICVALPAESGDRVKAWERRSEKPWKKKPPKQHRNPYVRSRTAEVERIERLVSLCRSRVGPRLAHLCVRPAYREPGEVEWIK